MNSLEQNKDFQRKILQDQRQKILQQFQLASVQWSDHQKSLAKNFKITKKAFEDSGRGRKKLN